MKTEDPDDVTAETYVTPGGDRIGYATASTTAADGWAYTPVPHLSEHEDSESGVLSSLSGIAGGFLGTRADAPTCTGVASDRITITGAGWRTCTSVETNGDVTLVAAYGLGVCSRVTVQKGRLASISHSSQAAKVIDALLPSTIVCAGSKLTSKLAPSETFTIQVNRNATSPRRPPTTSSEPLSTHSASSSTKPTSTGSPSRSR